jgi:hypothetical protein
VQHVTHLGVGLGGMSVVSVAMLSVSVMQQAATTS